MKIAVPIVIGSAVIAGSVLWIGRWEMVSPSMGGTFMLDHWTGTMMQCTSIKYPGEESYRLECEPPPETRKSDFRQTGTSSSGQTKTSP
jgi:hypothetical protein